MSTAVDSEYVSTLCNNRILKFKMSTIVDSHSLVRAAPVWCF